jgi:diphthamide synthase (EF-2-diphthine--ammonia ligase)
MRAAFAQPPLDATTAVAFGDLFLEDLRAYREQRMADAGRAARFPLWGADTRTLARAMVDAGFVATIVSVDLEHLPATALGRRYDHAFLDALPATVDPCGERGEFHTFVSAGPVLSERLDTRAGPIRRTERHAWLPLS